MVNQFARYFLVGCAALGLHLIVLGGLVELVGLNATLSSGIGFVVACCLNYWLQRCWVFRAHTSHAAAIGRYVMVTSATLVLNVGVFWVLHNVLLWWYPLAQVVTTGMIFVLNFLVNRCFTFRREEPTSSN